MTQLDLFSPVTFVSIDQRVADVSTHLIEHLTSKRSGFVVRQVLHPQTFKERAPKLSDRTTWKDPVLATVTVNTKRISLFQHKPTCACCGRTVDVFTVEQVDAEGSLPYVNAYSVTQGVHEMTVDHVLPKGFCGNDRDANRTTKCRLCNHEKAVLMSLPEIRAVAADITLYTKEWANHEFVMTVLKFQEFIHSLASGPVRKRAIGVLNTCAQNTSIQTKKASYQKRIKQMVTFMDSVNPPAPKAVLTVPAKATAPSKWWQQLWMFSYDLLTFFPK